MWRVWRPYHPLLLILQPLHLYPLSPSRSSGPPINNSSTGHLLIPETQFPNPPPQYLSSPLQDTHLPPVPLSSQPQPKWSQSQPRHPLAVFIDPSALWSDHSAVSTLRFQPICLQRSGPSQLRRWRALHVWSISRPNQPSLQSAGI